MWKRHFLIHVWLSRNHEALQRKASRANFTKPDHNRDEEKQDPWVILINDEKITRLRRQRVEGLHSRKNEGERIWCLTCLVFLKLKNESSVYGQNDGKLNCFQIQLCSHNFKWNRIDFSSVLTLLNLHIVLNWNL